MKNLSGEAKLYLTPFKIYYTCTLVLLIVRGSFMFINRNRNRISIATFLKVGLGNTLGKTRLPVTTGWPARQTRPRPTWQSWMYFERRMGTASGCWRNSRSSISSIPSITNIFQQPTLAPLQLFGISRNSFAVIHHLIKKMLLFCTSSYGSKGS